jgi:hypothetical protein
VSGQNLEKWPDSTSPNADVPRYEWSKLEVTGQGGHTSLSLSLFVVVDAFVCCGEFGISSLGDGDKDVCVDAHCLVICDLCIRFADYVKLAFNRQF